MANNKVLANGVQPTVTTIQTLYTAPAAGGGTRVVAFTASNATGNPETYDLHIVPSGGSADATNKIVPAGAVSATNGTDVPAEVQNQLIPANGTLEVKVSTGTTIAFRATGIEF